MASLKSKPTIIGAFERVSFPDFHPEQMIAKIDTGAYTGALHCTKIREINSEEGHALIFSPFDHPELELKETDFLVKHVRSSNGQSSTRYFIQTNIMICGKEYPIVLSLADRSEMKWPVLIGRKFLRANNFLVDARKPQHYGKARQK
jgi:hypothetical protein